MEQGSLTVFQFTQVACTDFIYPQRPDDRPTALIFSSCLPDRHQKADYTTNSQGQIDLENKPFCEIDRKCSVMMQTVFGHPPSSSGAAHLMLQSAAGMRERTAQDSLFTEENQHNFRGRILGRETPQNSPFGPKSLNPHLLLKSQ